MFSEDDPISPAWVLLHIRNLPVESSFIAEVRGGQRYRGWGPDRYMRVQQIDLLRIANYMFVLANSNPKKGKPKEPDPYPVPDNAPEERRKKQKTYKPGSFGAVAGQLITAKRRRMEAEGRVGQAQLVESRYQEE